MMENKEKLVFKTECASVPNTRIELKKPNEDRFFVDEKNGVIILLDGVTRVHSEYDERPYESASAEVGEIFIKTAYGFIVDNINSSDPESVILGAISFANEKLREFRDKKSVSEWNFYPATLGFVGLIRDNILYYVGVGDCMGVIIRRKAKIILGKEWSVEALDKLNITKNQRYGLYCNHPENPLSYTVFNGDDSVVTELDCSFVDLHAGDILFVVSDGIADYVKYEKSDILINQSPEQIILNSSDYDVPPYAEYADDKTIVKVTF